MTFREKFHRLVSRFPFKRQTARAASSPTSGRSGKRRRRRHVPLQISRDRVTRTEKALFIVLIVLAVVFFVKMSMQEKPRGVEIVSPEEVIFTPPR